MRSRTKEGNGSSERAVSLDSNASVHASSASSSLCKDVEAIHTRYDPTGPHTALILPIINFVSSLIVIVTRLIGLDAVVSMTLSAGLTVYVYNVTEENATFDGGE